MLLHYLKIAFRNLLKFKTQTIISILGLAIGFTAFSFTMSWIRYEMGYDSHNPNRDRIYMLAHIDPHVLGGMKPIAPEPLAGYLRNNFPEIESATLVRESYQDKYKIENSVVALDYSKLTTDTAFFSVFYPEIKKQFPTILLQEGINIISQSFAKKLKDNGQPEDKMNFDVIADQSKHSNVAFDVLNIKRFKLSGEEDCVWCSYPGSVYIRVNPKTNLAALQHKLDSIDIKDSMQGIMRFRLIPLKKAHYLFQNDVNIKFGHLKVFSAVALLVIFCGFFNYLMLFVNRIKLRTRELALRKVTGSNNLRLINLLLFEYLLVLAISLFIGGALNELFFTSFAKLSQIPASKSHFLIEMLQYASILIVFFTLLSFVPIVWFMKKSIRENIQLNTRTHDGLKNSFTLISVFLQLVIGIMLIFCTTVLFHQIWFLNNSDIGFNRHNVSEVPSYIHPVTVEQIKNITGVTDAIDYPQSFLPRGGWASFSEILDKGETSERKVEFEIYNVSMPHFFRFFEINILEGRAGNEEETGVCLINKTAKKAIGTKNPIGTKINNFTIIGVIPDLYIDSPLFPIKPSIYRSSKESGGVIGGNIAYRFEDGMRKKTENDIRKIAGKTTPEYSNPFSNMDETFKTYTKSERYLLILLGVMTGVAILIAVFGIYSMITLACSSRRKEIAIRKVNGARVREILALFFRTYFIVTLLAYIVAIPVGVLVMQRWLEQYTRRVSMDWWLFVGVFVLVAAIVFASIVFRVWKAARENPADVVKSE